MMLDMIAFHEKVMEIEGVAEAYGGAAAIEVLNQEGGKAADLYLDLLSDLKDRVGKFTEELMMLTCEAPDEVAERALAMTDGEFGAVFVSVSARAFLDAYCQIDDTYLEQLRKVNPDAAADLRRALYHDMPAQGYDDREPGGKGDEE